MLAAIITLSLLSLLVATEADPASAAADHPADKPLRPDGGICGKSSGDKPGRLAA